MPIHRRKAINAGIPCRSAGKSRIGIHFFAAVRPPVAAEADEHIGPVSQRGLETNPIAVTFAGAAAAGTGSSQGKASVCQALKRAGEGEDVSITAETCGCPGGLVSLGLGQMPAQGREKLVDFLVNREKVYCSRIAIHRGQQTVQAPVGVSSRIVFLPLSRAELLPDLVGFIGKPGSLPSAYKA